MNDTVIKVLAVADPAVAVYVDKKLDIIQKFDGKVEFNAVPWAEYYSTMMDVFAGKAYYDIIMVAGHLWLCDFVEKGYLAQIELENEDILPVILQEMKYKGKAYLSPSFCDGHMLAYRKSIVENKLGKLFGDVITAQEYYDAVKAIGETDGIPAVAVKAHSSEIFLDSLPFLRMNGKDVYDYSTNNAICDNKEIADGLKKYCELKNYAINGTENFGNAEIADAIKNKKAAMAFTWSGQLGVVVDENCVEPEDLGFATIENAWNVTWAFAISNNSKNKEKANELLKFLRSPEIDKLAGEFSGAPVRMGSYTDGEEKYPWYSCQMKMIENAVLLPDMKNAGDKNGVFYEEIYKAFIDGKTAEQAMADTQLRVNQIGK